jgi:hypothetical protein
MRSAVIVVRARSSYHGAQAWLFEFVGFGGRQVLASDGFDFAADNFSGESGAEKAAVEGSELAVIEFAAKGAEFAVDTLANDGGFVMFLSVFGEGGVNVLIGYAAGAQVAGDAKFALMADFGALADELFGVARVVEETVSLEAVHDGFNELIVVGAVREGSLHFMDGVGAAHEDARSGGVEIGFGFDVAGFGEHAPSIGAADKTVKEKDWRKACGGTVSRFGGAEGRQ